MIDTKLGRRWPYFRDGGFFGLAAYLTWFLTNHVSGELSAIRETLLLILGKLS